MLAAGAGVAGIAVLRAGRLDDFFHIVVVIRVDFALPEGALGLIKAVVADRVVQRRGNAGGLGHAVLVARAVREGMGSLAQQHMAVGAFPPVLIRVVHHAGIGVRAEVGSAAALTRALLNAARAAVAEAIPRVGRAAALAAAGSGVGFSVAVGYVFAHVVKQRIRFLLRGVAAPFAGIVRVPAALGAGGALSLEVLQIVSGGKLRIGSVVAARAGLVGIPADARAGRILRFMMHQIVPGGNLHTGGVVAL